MRIYYRLREEELVEKAKNDPDWSQRIRALSEIKQLSIPATYYDFSRYRQDFIEIAKTDPEPRVRKEAIGLMYNQSAAIEIAKTDPDRDVRDEAFRHIYDESFFIEVAKTDPDHFVRRSAIRKITDNPTLAYIYNNDENNDNRVLALEKIDDESFLIEIALNESNPDNLYKTLEKIEDADVLVEIYKHTWDSWVKQRIVRKLTWIAPRSLDKLKEFDKPYKR